MSLKRELQSAITMHSMWKAKLDECTETGIFDMLPDMVEKDNECFFGKWLYGNKISPDIRSSAEYKRVQEIHARFHQVAAEVVRLSLSGERNKAQEIMSPTGQYTLVTNELVNQLFAWAEKLD